MKFNFLNPFPKRKAINKSFTGDSNTFSFMYDNTTNTVIGEGSKRSFAGELKRNTSIATILNKQISMVSDSELKLYNSKDGTDTESTDKTALAFLDLLNNPNCQPKPNDWDDILSYLLTQYAYYGLTGLVVQCNGEFAPENLNSLMPVTRLTFSNHMNQVCYNASLKYGSYEQMIQFYYDEESKLYTAKYNDNDLILIVFGEYDYDSCKHVSPFTPLKDVILMQNYTMESSKTFYENSCRPSSIITVNLQDSDNEGSQTTADKEMIAKTITKFRSELKGSENTGKSITAPGMDIKVIPLNIPVNAVEIEAQLVTAKNIIYSFVAGGSLSAIEGQTEYSNNAIQKLKEFYDGTFAYIDKTIINVLNNFLQQYLTLHNSNILERKDIYLALDKSGSEFYKKYLESEASLKYQNNEITLNEIREIQSGLREKWGNLTPLENGDRLNAEIQKGNNLS